ncbi:terpenoid synthase [Suillus clintonianus]|uniref:terpenoid synthase n=1 Tax=Suillus clintonianus TaxID=1904413 RepID=UPI001B880716|nr:terpenoid synthase [Suillus clintonianus]KAG2124659.1 terpenoid synthase [Suillus clintonianus]
MDASQSSFSMARTALEVVHVNAGDGYDQPLEKFFIPDLLARWPFPRRLNHYYPKVRAESSAWLESFKAFSPKAQDAFNRCDCSLLSCLAHPIAKEEHVRSACDFTNLLFFIDEYTDISEEGEARKQKDAVMDALRHPHEPRPKAEWVGGEIARQFWERTIRNASGQSQKRFIAAFDEFLEGVVQQAIDRSGHHIRDIQSYFDVRRKSVGARSGFALLELGLDIPDEVISHPVVQDMEMASIDMIFLNNDIASYNVEQARGDEGHNIVTIVMHELDTDVNGAILWVADCHAKLETKFLEAMAAIPKWEELIDSQVREYCDGLGNCVRANNDWSFESERYFGTDGLEVQRKGWLLLMPRDRLKGREEIGPVLVGQPH